MYHFISVQQSGHVAQTQTDTTQGLSWLYLLNQALCLEAYIRSIAPSRLHIQYRAWHFRYDHYHSTGLPCFHFPMYKDFDPRVFSRHPPLTPEPEDNIEGQRLITTNYSDILSYPQSFTFSQANHTNHRRQCLREQIPSS